MSEAMHEAMHEAAFYELPISLLKAFLNELNKSLDVYAPMRRAGVSAFKPLAALSNGWRLDLEKPTLYSLKRLLFPQKEELFSWERLAHTVKIQETLLSEAQLSATKPLLVFAARACDIAGIEFLKAFAKDIYFEQRLKLLHTTALLCEKEFATCFCRSIGSWREATKSDLILAHIGKAMLIGAMSENGSALLSATKAMLKKAKPVAVAKAQTLLKKGPAARGSRLSPAKILATLRDAYLKNIESFWDAGAWARAGKRCFGCAGCTIVCPSCICFDWLDEATYDGRIGWRARGWDSCTLLDFTRIAGDYHFRKEVYERLRWRIAHKLLLQGADIGRSACSGCGRCIAICPANIDMRKTASQVAKELKMKELKKR